MVERNLSIDAIFGALADSTRRDIIERLLSGELSVGEIAKVYDMSLAAVSKHLSILEQTCLVVKRRAGKRQMASVSPLAIRVAKEYLQGYEALWNGRFSVAEQLITEDT